jgi:GTPase
MLVDEVVLKIKGGDGGDGRVAFYPRRGKPCGGDGGPGGDVIAKVKSDITSLFAFLSRRKLKAQNGGQGESHEKKGLRGEDLILYFPKGCRAEDIDTGEIIDIDKSDTSEGLLIAKGGRGGYGNAHISRIQKGIFGKANTGSMGKVRNLKITMRLIADIGLIGLPNAGKSSLLNALTNSQAKVADYPFTTIDPNLGVMECDGTQSHTDKSFGHVIIADIPGLIEGASGGRGLGARFLKHVEKVKKFAHCVSCESDTALDDYQKVRKELEIYNKNLLNIPEVILITKSDLLTEHKKNYLKKSLETHSLRLIFCSIIDEKSLKDLRSEICSEITPKNTFSLSDHHRSLN